jgi:hypothetical protein
VTSVPPPPAATPLDPEQLRRIESTHRGFLYQHLYVVGCLLLAQRAGVREVLVERDEDVELRLSQVHIYIQVKTRSAALVPSDIEGALERFATLRRLHAAESESLASAVVSSVSSPTLAGRSGDAMFVIVSNVAPGPSVMAALDDPSWPSDTSVLWPGSMLAPPVGLAPAWPSVEAAVDWCTNAAAVPYSRVTPTTLVWKLAALAQAAAMGGVGTEVEAHTFVVERLPELFEQVVRSLQELPDAPVPYLPQEHEPEAAIDAAVRLIVGPSGAGKTAWAANRASHDAQPAAYFSAGATGATFAAALVQEVAARFGFSTPGGLSAVLMPGVSGVDALRALSLSLRARGVAPVVVVDDAHRIAADEVLQVVAAAPEFRWLLLAHPGPTVAQIEARLGVRAEHLSGWSLDTIAVALRGEGCAADAPTCHRVRSLTAGLPLFVHNLAQLARAHHAGDVSELCELVERGAHLEQTAQEVLLATSLGALSATSRKVADLLGIARVALTGEEVARLADVIGITSVAAARALRELSAWGIAQSPRYRRVRLHDAFGLLCDGSALDANHRAAVLRDLRDLLDPAVRGFELDRGTRFLEILPLVGGTERLIEIASNEIENLVELGLAPHVVKVLEATAADSEADPSDRFWAVDSLAFLALQSGRSDEAAMRVREMEYLASSGDLPNRARQALLVKRLLIAGTRGDARAARELYAAVVAESETDATLRRIARYNLACALWRAEEFKAAACEAWELGMEYYDVVGLDPARVYRATVPDVGRMLPDREVIFDLKRLADTLDLYARAKAALGETYGLAKLHAMKFYTVCGAYQSVVKTGQDAVDDFINMGDIVSARSFLEETLLPSVEELRLVDHLVSVRAQYAVVLAYSGDIMAARAEMRRLRTFGESSSAIQRDELHNQEELVEAISAGVVSLPSPVPSRGGDIGLGPLRAAPRPGRNDPCPCGSGAKFKRCCGA